MGRIRTIKPEMFRHEALQDMEAEHAGSYTMLTFIGLLTTADKSGVFEWKPRQLKLDILPFLEFDMDATLQILIEKGFIQRFSKDGECYGYIPTFVKHQRITGNEAKYPAKYPQPSGHVLPDEIPFEKPTQEDVESEMLNNLSVGVSRVTEAIRRKAGAEALMFFNYYEGENWKTKDGTEITDWRKAANTWLLRGETMRSGRSIPETPNQRKPRF